MVFDSTDTARLDSNLQGRTAIDPVAACRVLDKRTLADCAKRPRSGHSRNDERSCQSLLQLKSAVIADAERMRLLRFTKKTEHEAPFLHSEGCEGFISLGRRALRRSKEPSSCAGEVGHKHR